VSLRRLGLKESSPSARIHFTNPGSEAAHGSSTGSTRAGGPYRQLRDGESYPVGVDEGRDELRVAKARAGSPDRVHRMDAGWSPEAFDVCRVEGR
jgi:hypothetical protein